MNSIESGSEDITKNIVMKSNKETSNDTLNPKSGIYKIVNKVDGKYYVGSSKNIIKRWSTHTNKLIRGVHKNQKLQSAWNKHKESSFDFLIVEETIQSQLLTNEQKYLDIAKSEQDKCYNLIFDSTGGNLEPDSIEKIRQKAIGRKPSVETRDKMSKKRHSEENKKHLRDINLGEKNHFYGKTHTTETKSRIGTLAKSRYIIPEKNPNYDHKLYHFINDITNESFNGSRYDFCEKFNLNRTTISDLIYGRSVKTRSGWRLDTHQ